MGTKRSQLYTWARGLGEFGDCPQQWLRQWDLARVVWQQQLTISGTHYMRFQSAEINAQYLNGTPATFIEIIRYDKLSHTVYDELFRDTVVAPDNALVMFTSMRIAR